MAEQKSHPTALPDRHSERYAELLGWRKSKNVFVNEALDVQLRSMLPTWLMLLTAAIPVTALLIHAINQGRTSGLPLLGLWLVPLLGWSSQLIPAVKDLPPSKRAILVSILALVLGASMSLTMYDVIASTGSVSALIVLGGAALLMIASFSRILGAMFSFASGLLLTGPLAAGNASGLAAGMAAAGCMGFLAIRIARSEFFSNAERSAAAFRAARASRLLDEVEQNSPSWFWETDRHGHITFISPKVVKWMETRTGLAGKPLASIAVENEELGPVGIGERTLGFYLSTRTAFSDLAVKAMGSAEERWWSISGRPVIDALGHFRGFIGTGTDLTEQRRSEAEVNKLARFDPLTGLANRSEIGNVLDKSLQGKPGEARSTALMLVDLDRFKSVNDLYGHPTGDELLKQVTARFGQVIGAQGQIGRLGGDEFKVVLPGLSDRTALSAIARSMIQTAARPFIINAATINIGASIGVAIAPDDGVTSEELVRHADMALYAAKDAGRGVHRFFEQEMHSVAAARHVLETDMREALAQGEFRLVYQPIVSLGRNCIVGFEALIRWQHPTRGPVSPGEFIPIAEECGLIEQIGEWALREAAREASSWAVDARVAVNVSTIQFTNPAFPAVVASVLAQSGILPNRLELEITESVFVSDDEATDQQFAALKRLGIRLALDDFGTGYSSLGYLKRAPFDKIKIDQSFVRGASLGHNKNAAIIKAIVSLADTMAMETTAEGVETQDEIEFMRGLGCSHIQGFVYGKPLEASDLRQRLGARGDEAIAVGHKAMREPRVRVLRRARMSINGGIRPAIIRNLSSQGAMVEAEYWVPPGTEVMIDITDAMTVTARVSWADDGKIGLKFNERVNLAEVIPQASKFGRAG